MKAINKNFLLIGISAALVGVFSTMLVAQNPKSSLQLSEQNQPSQTVFVMEREKTHLGGGAAISPDGKLLAYIGNDDGLYLHNLADGKEQLLLKEAEPGLDVFLNPVFSPDGIRVLFSASGGTRYYPSNIYSIKIDGSSLERLTQAKALSPRELEKESNPIYAQYFYSAQYAPNGTRILMRLYSAMQGTDNVALIDSSGTHLEVIGRGTPLFWSSDAQAVYYSQGDTVKKFNLSSKDNQIVDGLRGKIIGKLPDRDVFALDDGASITLESVQDRTTVTLAKWNTPRVKSVVRTNSKNDATNRDQLTLNSLQWSRSGRSLLIYEGDTMERFEVVEPGKM
jgi:WD40-like Beta Propeller Repeat